MNSVFRPNYLEIEGFEANYNFNNSQFEIISKWASPNFELSNLFELIANDGNLDDFKNLCKLMFNYNVISSFNHTDNNEKYQTMTFIELNNNNNKYQPLSQETANRIAARFYRIQIDGIPKRKKINKRYLN